MKKIAVLMFIVFTICKAQDPIVLGVCELVFEGEMTQNDAKMVSERIRNIISQNSKYIIIDENLTNDLMKAQNIEYFPPCDKKDCLVQFGKIIYANRVIGGKILRTGNAINLELEYADVSADSVVNYVNSSIQAGRDDFLNVYLPGICDTLLNSSVKKIEFNENKSVASVSDSSGKQKSFGRKFLKGAGITSLLAAAGFGIGYLVVHSGNDGTNGNDDGIIPLDGEPIRTRQ